ncbi:MAG: hypothetical protein ACFFD4_21205 [Candidatus Odinarchaeota archaeon]
MVFISFPSFSLLIFSPLQGDLFGRLKNFLSQATGNSSNEPLFSVLKSDKSIFTYDNASFILVILAGKSSPMIFHSGINTPLDDILENSTGNLDLYNKIIRRLIKEIEVTVTTDSDYLFRLLDLLVKLSPDQATIEPVKSLLLALLLGDIPNKLKKLAKKLLFI